MVRVCGEVTRWERRGKRRKRQGEIWGETGGGGETTEMGEMGDGLLLGL